MALRSVRCFSWLLLVAALLKVCSAKFIYGKEAEKLCQAYRKVCPRSKVCAVQVIDISTVVKFPVCVHQFEVRVRSRVCQQAPSPGRCFAQFRRWYFNVHMAACSWFTYGGCGGNGNNFRSRAECERMCVVGQPTDRRAVSDVSARQPSSALSRHNGERHRQRTPESWQHSGGSYSPEDRRTDRGQRVPMDDNRRYQQQWQNNTKIYNNPNKPYEAAVNNRRNDVPSNPSDAMSHGNVYDSNGKASIDSKNWRDKPKANSYDQSSFDINAMPYAHTSARPTTLSGNWQDRMHRNDDSQYGAEGVSTFRPPLQLRGSLDGNRPIRTNPGPSYQSVNNDANMPAAWQVPQNQQSSFPVKASGSADNTRRLSDFPDRRLASFSDRTRRLTDNQRIEMVSNVPKKPRIKINTGVVPQPRTPHRVLSLLSRDPGDDSMASNPIDVRPSVMSSLRASYAPDAKETIRRFPSRADKRNKNRTRQRRRRRRRRNRRRRRGRGRKRAGKKRRRNRMKKVASGGKTVLRGDKETSTSPTNPASLDKNVPQKPSRRLAEFRVQDTVHAPPLKIQSDEVLEEMSDRANQEDERKRRKRRRKQRGRGKMGIVGGVNRTSAGEQYYEGIRLFGLLASSNNATEVKT